jgi:hypothetical protein
MMLAIKIVTAAVILLSVIFRAAIDFFWKDKRTRRYRYARNGFVAAAIMAAVLNVVVLVIDEVRRQSTNEAERKQKTEFEDLSLGALSPEVWVFLYSSNKLICPRFEKTFTVSKLDFQMVSQFEIGPQPILALLVVNPNSFPIYDLRINLLRRDSQPRQLYSLRQRYLQNRRYSALLSSRP